MIEMIQAPGLATVQDLGRPGLRAQGVPPGGALDPWALRLANTIVGNESDAAGIEWLLGGGRIRFLKPMPLALAGAEVAAFLDHPHQLAFARAGDVLRIDFCGTDEASGECLYLAFGGGIDTAPTLGSRSTLLAAALGGFHGRRLQSGDRLPTARRRWPPPRFAATLLAGCPWRRPRPAIRFVPGPQWAEFGSDWQEAFCAVDFHVGRERDRAGMRLQSPLPPPALGFARPSEPVTPGAIQILPTGQPIVLLADGPTVGGYPKIGTVFGADLGRLAQHRAGAAVRFAAGTVEEAAHALREAETWLRVLRAATRPAKPALPPPLFEERNWPVLPASNPAPAAPPFVH